MPVAALRKAFNPCGSPQAVPRQAVTAEGRGGDGGVRPIFGTLFAMATGGPTRAKASKPVGRCAVGVTCWRRRITASAVRRGVAKLGTKNGGLSPPVGATPPRPRGFRKHQYAIRNPAEERVCRRRGNVQVPAGKASLAAGAGNRTKPNIQGDCGGHAADSNRRPGLLAQLKVRRMLRTAWARGR